MRIAIHDYGGYAFIVHLSRSLAHRGHEVLHLYAGYNPTPKGYVEERPNDPAGFRIRAVHTRRPLQKYSLFIRWMQEWEYGHKAAAQIMGFGPDVVLCANTPLDSLRSIERGCRRDGTPLILWMQDVLGEAMRIFLGRKLGVVGRWIGHIYAQEELDISARCAATIVLSEEFRDYLLGCGIPASRVFVIPNWAPIAEIPLVPKANPWSQSHNLSGRFCFLYTGTLGMKHDPARLLGLAEGLKEVSPVQVVVVSEGSGAKWLMREARARGFENMTLMPLQPMNLYPQILGSADVLVAVLEASAGEFSVPSKVLSYLCAGRPILMSVPVDNPASGIVLDARAGIVVQPDDAEGFLAAARLLFRDRRRGEELGRNGRAYAEKHVDQERITDEFEGILQAAVRSVDAG